MKRLLVSCGMDDVERASVWRLPILLTVWAAHVGKNVMDMCCTGTRVPLQDSQQNPFGKKSPETHTTHSCIVQGHQQDGNQL
jgi:hypothetical protein